MTPLAKPSGIPLAEHRQHVFDEAKALLAAWPLLAEKYARLVPGGDLPQLVRRSAWYHDEGKQHPHWQGACRRDYDAYRVWREARGLDPAGVNAGDYGRYLAEMRTAKRAVGTALRDAALRHEFASLTRCEAAGIELGLAERAAIAAHHGRLAARHEHRWLNDGEQVPGSHKQEGEFAQTWRSFLQTDDEVIRSQADPLLWRYEVAAVRALLRLADTRASRREAGGKLARIEPFRYTCPYGDNLRDVQRLALAHAEDPVTILRAPTGSGKTDGAFLWGQRQIELGRADRLVVAMPTRFTSNALALSNAEALSQTGLYHSSAWHARYADRPRGTLEHDLAREELKLARILATPVTVCTVDHLLIALTGSHEDHHATYFFLANSAVVFDEVDFYDPFVQANLVILLRALRTLDVPVLLMSATVPESARALYGVTAEIRQTQQDASGERVVRRHPPVERPEDAADLLRRMLSAGTGIVYANTVERAYRTYRWLCDAVNNPEGVPVYLYHSRFTEPDKKQIEEALVGTAHAPGALGRRAWENACARGIAVLTQIGEMSVNISAPLMLSDLCPWDRLAQRMGRLARFRESIPEGELWVADPHRDGELYPAPYGSFDRTAGWVAGEPLLETRRQLDSLLEEASGAIRLVPSDLVREVNRLYPEAPEWDADTAANADRLDQLIRQNWLIVQRVEAIEEEGGVRGGWRSRDIPAQQTAIVHLPDDLPEDGPYRFESYDDAQGFLLEHAVECPAYLVDRGRKRGVMSPFTYVVGDDRRAEKEQCAFYCKYERPVAGQGGGLGNLALREDEDSFGRAAL